MKIYGTINQQGKFTPQEAAIFKAAFKKHAGGWVELELTRLPKRSNPLNRYYWGVVLPICSEALTETQGEEISQEEAHEFFKRRFLPAKITAGGTEFEFGKSTAKLDNTGFLTYLEQIKQFAADYLGVIIPESNEPPIPTE